MNKYTKKIYLLVSLPLVLCGCDTSEKLTDDYTDKEQVIFESSLKEILNSRANSDEYVVNQSFNLMFKGNAGYEIGKVDFNNSGIGFSLRYDNDGKLMDLIWGDVNPNENNGNTYSFYLDNLTPGFDGITNVKLPENPEDNPYSIGIYKNDDDTNYNDDYNTKDLIWGALENTERNTIEEVDLYHVMSRFCLRLCIDNSAVGKDKFPLSATISNLFQTPIEFDRLTGNLQLEENPIEEPYSIVDNQTKNWTIEKDESNPNITYYTSPDFVIPPQEFVSTARPRLSVKLLDNTTYSGLFPIAMNLIGADGSLTPWTMSFLRGYRIMLNVKISNNMADLQFLPVTMLDWWEVDEKTVTGYQASVANEEDFKNLIKAYNDERISEFYKWGFKRSDGTWVFNIFTNFSIKASEYSSHMEEKENLPYEFYIFDATVSVSLDSENEVYLNTLNNGAQQLKNLLNKGIRPTEEFTGNGEGNNTGQ